MKPGSTCPVDGYIQEAHALCKAANVLFMADEVQTGIARTGALLATCGTCTAPAIASAKPNTSRPTCSSSARPSQAGVYPVSAVLADDAVMGVIHPGQHGSTFGGNPVGGAVAMAALEVVKDEHLAQQARDLGNRFRAAMES